MRTWFNLLALFAAAFCLQAQDTDLQKGWNQYLAAHQETPEDYVIGKFQNHDIVFLGELHHVQQNLDFVQRLIPKLYASGIYTLGWEFTNTEDQASLDQLLNAPA